jgi:pyruvate,water dikinase
MTTVATATELQFIRRFEDVGIDDVPLVGGKNASLGEMCRELGSQGVKLADGFAITADAYRYFMEQNGLDGRIKMILSDLDVHDIKNLQQRGRQVRHEILAAELPESLSAEILTAYEELSDGCELVDVAVRSSATAEDLPDASFAGQQETYLNVQGDAALLDTCRRCFASLFTDRAISYREDKGFDHFKVALSIGVQRMVRSDLASSGVMFSIDTETGFRDVVLINAAYGLGENVVQGSVNPDEFYVFKPTLREGHRPILQKTCGSKEFKLVYDTGGGKMVKNVPVPPDDRIRFAITDDEILMLARWACLIEEHYSAKRGEFTPMDMEWAKDGRTGELFILQARPETVQSQKKTDSLQVYRLCRPVAEVAKTSGAAQPSELLSSSATSCPQVLCRGRSVGEKIATGRVRIVKNVEHLHQVQAGDVLVTDKTDPDWEPTMKKAAAIVTNRGGRTCHAAIVSRELGLPAIVGTNDGTDVLAEGQVVTVSCAEGETGFVYKGELPFEIEEIPLEQTERPHTKIMMNVANPDEALRLSLLPNDGVGLARLEFIINNTIGIHPLALLDYKHLDDVAVIRQIDQATVGYDRKHEYFIDKLAQGVATIAAAFYPKDVIVRMSDFKSNEYANLIGGHLYEPTEENPMIGFRGASRYYDERYKRGFMLECCAMERVRRDMGLTNVKLMIPFCRTVEEGRRVISELEYHGLLRGIDGLEVYVMCEIPSNVILANEFAEVFDGFSIGSNDLTQLVLGVDRDSEIVAHVFDERNDAVKKMIAHVIREAKGCDRKIGICGQAPSDYPEFAQFLVEQGIDSISLTPDVIVKTTLSVLEMEKALAGAP